MRCRWAILLTVGLWGGVAGQSGTTLLYEDLSGTGSFVHTGTFLVSSEEALAAYAAHPWARQGTNGLFARWAPGGNPRIGYGERLAEFLGAHYPMIPAPAATGNPGCTQTAFPNFRTWCGVPPPCGTYYCGVLQILNWQLEHVGCPGLSCPSGAGCGRTTNTVTSTVLTGGGCHCQFLACVAAVPIRVVSYTTNGPLCACVSPAPGCVSMGTGSNYSFFTLACRCVTEPRIGTTLQFSWGSGNPGSVLVGGACVPAPISWLGCAVENLWLLPFILFGPFGYPSGIGLQIPNDPQLIGYVVCLQAAVQSSGAPPSCWAASEGVRVTIQP